MYSFSYLEPICCSMSTSNSCFLIFIQISQEAGQVVRYFHLFQNFPQFIVIHSNAEEAEVEQFYEDLQELTPKKHILFIVGDWNAKVGSQEISGVKGKFSLAVQNEAGQRLIEFCQKNTLVIANTLFQQHKRRLYTWTSPDGQHRNQIDYILCS